MMITIGGLTFILFSHLIHCAEPFELKLHYILSHQQSTIVQAKDITLNIPISNPALRYSQARLREVLAQYLQQ